MESALNKNLSCDCHINHLIVDFINYVIEKDSTLYRVTELYKSCKKDNKKIDKSKIIIHDIVIGRETSIDIACSRYHRTKSISPSETRYNGKKLKGEDSYHSSCNWFQLYI